MEAKRRLFNTFSQFSILKGPLSGVRHFMAIESHLKMTKMFFNCWFLRNLNFCLEFSDHVEKQLDHFMTYKLGNK